MIPIVGQPMHYFEHKGDEPLAAIVVHVWSATIVNLAIFDRRGNPITDPATSIRLADPDDPPESGRFCTTIQVTRAMRRPEAGEGPVAENTPAPGAAATDPFAEPAAAPK